MWSYCIERLLQALLLLFFASVAVFLLLRLIPGDPALVIAGPNARDEQLAAVREEMGLDEPLVVQYWIWLKQAVQGDLGESFVSGYPVNELIRDRAAATAQLALAALIVAVAIAFPVGTVLALKPRSLGARFLSAWMALMLAVPTFWLGLLLLLVFGLTFEWFPMSGYVSLLEDPIDAIRHLALPAITLAAGLSAVLARMLRASLLEILGNDHVRTARAKGLPQSAVVRGHVIRNAMIPVVTVLGIQLGQLLGGAVVTEAIFDWSGLGQLILQAINNRDYTVVQGTMLFLVSVFVLVNLLVDLSYGLLDPRIRHSQ